ncbi:HdeD family acid-resistance protein [Methylocella sp.]|uniref:HdeD family acid-resistance protein n=1 Tax=Methylocella sp. TaxID=1978226 RepID=UPI0037847143
MTNPPSASTPSGLPDPAVLPTSLARAMGGHWKWILAEGVLLLVLGVLAVLTPFVAGVATALFVGWLFLFSGVVGLVVSFQSRGDPGFWWGVFSSAIALLAGLALLFNPIGGLFTLTFVLIAYFLIDGVLTILLGLQQKKALATGWGWVVASGVVDLVLAVLVILGLPGSFLWAVGLIVGIDLAFGGASIIGIALAARRALEEPHAGAARPA